MNDGKQIEQVKLTLPAQAEYVDLVRLTLYGIASRIGFTYEEIEDMKVAVSEACNNSVLYAYNRHDGMVEIVFDIGEHELSLTVIDEGESFDANNKPNGVQGWHHKQLDEVQAGGLGFYLMQALMDEVEISSTAGQGTVVKMKKRKLFSGELL
ncbi:anti-sigma B factor RsbW [Paenibacillus sp. 481]|uniref:anti-sigma B factor RsbW n=1 Tax=Paenibacillus sp. 481 TaxID=2835869 RepID=UPI001E2F792C|nr:anti-sigma B factor RsbW [Paenibacillus sp. 481]UHA74766.1 anti-sigma B factor RsbW [Paenibacillus sp. 481]